MQIKSVLYIVDALPGTLRYFSNHTMPSIWYGKLQRQVINLLKDNSNSVDCYIRFSPSDTCYNPNIELARQNNIHIVEEKPVNFLMKTHYDLIILDAVATTLLQTLCTKSQILLLVHKDFIKIDREAIEMLSKRVFVMESESDYLAFIRNILCSALIQPMNLNDEFLLKYGIGSIESDPQKLIVSSLYEILN